MFTIGYGIDVHKFAEERKLLIGGIEIPYKKGLLGHSDADVLIHAICDALLGAAGLGDIGTHFPDTEEKFRNIDSKKILADVVSKIENLNFKIINIDSTIIAQSPKFSSHIDSMRKTLAAILKIEKQFINIKVTTTEKLGFIGREEGIEARAICLLEK